MPVEGPNCNPLQWWNSRWTNFAVLSKLAYHYLSCPAMSSEAERLFSRISPLLGDDRRSLGPDSVESEVLLHKWQLHGHIRINKHSPFWVLS